MKTWALTEEQERTNTQVIVYLAVLIARKRDIIIVRATEEQAERFFARARKTVMTMCR